MGGASTTGCTTRDDHDVKDPAAQEAGGAGGLVARAALRGGRASDAVIVEAIEVVARARGSCVGGGSAEEGGKQGKGKKGCVGGDSKGEVGSKGPAKGRACCEAGGKPRAGCWEGVFQDRSLESHGNAERCERFINARVPRLMETAPIRTIGRCG